MRFVYVLCFIAVLCFVAGAAVANPNYSVPKNWYYQQHDVRATYPESEPNDTCGRDQQVACGDIVSPAYLDAGTQDWYVFNGTANDVMNLWTGPVNSGDSCDTYIELYANDCATMLAYNDDYGSLYSRIDSFVAPYTGVYHLKVRGYGSSSSGPYAAHFECGTAPPPPPGDTCDTAANIPDCTAGALQGDTTTYTNNYDPGSGGCSSGYPEAGRDVVYYLDLVAGDHLDMTYTQLNTDGAFYLVTDCSNVAGSCVIGADATVTGQPEHWTYTVQNGGRFYLILDSYGTNTGGPWTLTYTITCVIPEACCFADGHCEMQYPADCRAMGGTPQGSGTNCDTAHCEVVASKPSTWGQIKSNYR